MREDTATGVLEKVGRTAVGQAVAGSSSLTTRESLLPAVRQDEIRPNVRLFAEQGAAVIGATRRRLSPILIGFLVVVALPTVLSGFYFSFAASNAYVAEFRATIRSVEPIKSAGMGALLGLAGASQSTNDANAVVQYLQSRDALEDVDKAVNLHADYGANTVDWLSRMRDASSIEAFQRYWRRHLDAYYEATTGTIVVKISAFTPQMALGAATAALTLSEALVNRLSTRSHSDSVLFAEKQLAEAEQRLTSANQRLRDVQDQERILDPQKSAAATLALSAKLREQLTTLKSTLAVQRNYMTQDSPVIKIMREQIDGVQRELDGINASATGAAEAGAAKPLSSVLGTFDLVESDRGFAEKNYQSTLTALEAARIEASRQQVYLATIVRPELPEEASFPKPLINTATVFAIALTVFTIGLLSVFAVKEHV